MTNELLEEKINEPVRTLTTIPSESRYKLLKRSIRILLYRQTESDYNYFNKADLH